MTNLPETAEELGIAFDAGMGDLAPIVQKAQDACQREQITWSTWYEARGLSKWGVQKLLNPQAPSYNRKKLDDGCDATVSQDDLVDPEPTYIPEHEPPDPPIDPVEGQPKVGNDWSGTVDPSPPKDTLVPRIEALAGQCSGEQLEAATTALIMLCKDTGRWKITKLGKGSFRVDKVPEVQYDPTKSELNHTQFPQHGERRYVPK